MTDNQESLNFSTLVTSIQRVNEKMAAQAGRAINVSLTLRNWVIGAYIDNYELNGSDQADYGDKLLSELAKRLTGINVSNCNRRQLYRYLRFYRLYPQIGEIESAQLQKMLPVERPGMEKVGTPSPQLQFTGEYLVQRLSYSHFELIADLDDPSKRIFYETECIRGNWSVRELKRQIGSLYYERSGLSENKEKLAKLVQSRVEASEPKLAIRDPYVFEFLGIKSCEVMRESDLEDQLLDKLQGFLLELGHGFCFEERQKRILIGDTHGFIDLVFYHRILKCHALVEYALAGMANHLFVSRYQLELPQKKEIQRFLEDKMREVRE